MEKQRFRQTLFRYDRQHQNHRILSMLGGSTGPEARTLPCISARILLVPLVDRHRARWGGERARVASRGGLRRDVGVLAPRGDPPAVRDRVRSLANGPERPGASRVRCRRRPRPGRRVGPLAPASCRRRVPRGRDRGCTGGTDPTGWGCDLAARAILVRRILDVPLDSGKFPGLAALALPRARLPFSARPQPAPGAPPDLPRARCLSSRSGSGTSGST